MRAHAWELSLVWELALATRARAMSKLVDRAADAAPRLNDTIDKYLSGMLTPEVIGCFNRNVFVSDVPL